MAHQYMPQLKEEIRDAVLGNVGTIGAFRIGAEDAENLEKQFEPGFSRFDLVNLDNFSMIIKMMIDNKISTPFKMNTLPMPKGKPELAEAIKKISKLKYSRAKAIVEEEITSRSFVDLPPAPPPIEVIPDNPVPVNVELDPLVAEEPPAPTVIV